jgi:aspartyl protease family protein
MKVITIGRDSDNDIVVNDSKVSRHHLQIVCEGARFRVVDLNSTNGIFVNDRKIGGESLLTASDTVRIGNTVLPWQNYFAKSGRTATKTNPALVWLVGVTAALAIIVLGMYFVIKQDDKPHSEPSTKTMIKMHCENGNCYVPVKINGQELNFVFDTGASSILISSLEANLLVKNGTLKRTDIVGEELYGTASGDIAVGTIIMLKTVQIGDRELNDIEATVVENSSASCLLGQTALSRFGKYTIDNQNNKIIFEE